MGDTQKTMTISAMSFRGCNRFSPSLMSLHLLGWNNPSCPFLDHVKGLLKSIFMTIVGAHPLGYSRSSNDLLMLNYLLKSAPRSFPKLRGPMAQWHPEKKKHPIDIHTTRNTGMTGTSKKRYADQSPRSQDIVPSFCVDYECSFLARNICKNWTWGIMKSTIFAGGSNLMKIYGIVERFPLKNRVDDFWVLVMSSM